MGHDIDIINLETGEIVTKLYFSSGPWWEYFKDGLPDMAHGHTGKIIAKKVKELLKPLKDIVADDKTVNIWGTYINNKKECNDSKLLIRKFKSIYKNIVFFKNIQKV